MTKYLVSIHKSDRTVSPTVWTRAGMGHRPVDPECNPHLIGTRARDSTACVSVGGRRGRDPQSLDRSARPIRTEGWPLDSRYFEDDLVKILELPVLARLDGVCPKPRDVTNSLVGPCTECEPADPLHHTAEGASRINLELIALGLYAAV